jgi:hypothetical protein
MKTAMTDNATIAFRLLPLIAGSSSSSKTPLLKMGTAAPAFNNAALQRLD